MKVTDILRSEHEVILGVLGALEELAARAGSGRGLDRESAAQALDFLRNFADRCHHGKEEQHFFPALVARGLPREVGPLAVMLGEHVEGRALIARMGDALALDASKPNAASEFAVAAQAYVTLLRDHIDKENGVLFPMGDGMLSDEQQTALLRSVESFEHLDMGAGTHERYLASARELCERMGVPSTVHGSAPAGGCCGHHTSCSSRATPEAPATTRAR